MKEQHVATPPHPPDKHATSADAASVSETQKAVTPSVRWAISLSIILGSLTNAVMMGSVNVAVPAMMTYLQADVTQIQWVLSSFMIARTVVQPTLGWIGGRLGNRRLYLGGLSLYIVTSMLCGLAWDLESMIFFRVLQGMSAGYLFPLAMTILHEIYPSDKRGMAMGIFMAGMSFGPAIGPSLGGYLVDHLSWRAVFYINFPIGLVALVAAALTLPAGGVRQHRSLDLLGLVTMTTFVVTLLVAVSETRTYGWTSPYVLGLLTAAVAMLLAFVWAELTRAAPLVNRQIFTNVPFVLSALVTFLESFTNFAMSLIIALFLQKGLGLSAQQAGEIMFPAAFVWGLASFFSGRLSDRIESRWLILAGSLSQAVVLALFVGITPASSAMAIAGLMIMRSLTRGLIQSPIITLSMVVLPDHQVRLGAGLRGLINSLGATFGVAISGFFLQQRLAVWTQFFQDYPPPVMAVEMPDSWLAQEATTYAAHDLFLAAAVAVVLTAIPALWLRDRRVS
jgi:EmrB/QacA subfamily drug resistance transporter